MNEVSRTIDAVAFATSDLVQPITVVTAAGQFLLTELAETDPLRWDVTQALGALMAARKSIESATETLLTLVTKDHEHTLSETDVPDAGRHRVDNVVVNSFGIDRARSERIIGSVTSLRFHS